MNKALRQIFWGYVFIFIRIHIGFDLLADPIGYFLIFSGCSKLVEVNPVAKKAKIIALVGAFVSFPSVFVNLSEIPLPFGWSTYAGFLLVFKLIIGFYLFFVLIEATKTLGDQALQQRAENTFKFFVAIQLFTLALQSFSMNVSGDGWVALSLFSLLSSLIVDILFLLLIGAIRRASPEQLV